MQEFEDADEGMGLHRLLALNVLCIDGSVRGESEKPLFLGASDNEDDRWGFLPSLISHLKIYNMREGKGNQVDSTTISPLFESCLLSIVQSRGIYQRWPPPSLERLLTINYGILEERFSKSKEDYCHLLYEIPYSHIGGRQIN